MSQWGFYFDQSRCLGCKTCMVACKNWNDLRRGDVNINVLNTANYEVAENENEKKEFFIGQDGKTNYEYYRKYYMKENLRRVTSFEKGTTTLNGKAFLSTFDRRYLAISCNHCTDPACIKACPTGVISKDLETGAVLTSREGCISCGRCRDACPWDAPQYYDEKFASYSLSDPNRPKMTKCTLCVDRITEGLKPACVAACWNRALDAGPMEELKSRYADRYTDRLDEFADSAVPTLGLTSTGPNVIFKKK